MSEPFINKVAESGLITLDLEKYYPRGETALFDLKDHLFMGMILKEKDFREGLKSHDWSKYAGKNVALFCSADAIIPVWAWMLAATYLQPVATEIVMGDEKELHKQLYLKNLAAIDISEFEGKRRVTLQHMTAAEVDAQEARIKAALEQKKKDSEKPLPKPSRAVPTPSPRQRCRNSRTACEEAARACSSISRQSAPAGGAPRSRAARSTPGRQVEVTTVGSANSESSSSPG